MPYLPPGTHARVSTGAALRCLPWTQQMALLDGVSPRSRAASASSCPSCPIPAARLGTGLQGKAGLHLGRTGELCSFHRKNWCTNCFRCNAGNPCQHANTAGHSSGGLCSSAKGRKPGCSLLESHSWLLPRASLGQTEFT